MSVVVDAGVRPLNSTLYALLEHKFGDVRIANPGVSAAVERFPDPVHPGRHITRSSHWGEYYCVCCPFCNDVGHKLWINHRYGAGYDPNTGRRADTFLAVCYKNDCVRGRAQQLEDIIFGPGKKMPTKIGVSVGVKPPTAESISPPGEIVLLSDLPDDHPANLYLRSRNFDPAVLAARFGVGVCVEPSPAYSIMRGRIYIPVYFSGQLVGWQGRIVTPPDGKPKYFTQGSKSRVLYNYGVAARQPYLVVVEGVPSVWRIGPPAVSLFGKTLSQWQQNTIGTTWAGKPVFVVLDSGADEAAALEKIAMQLYRYPIELVPVQMPDERDPADYELVEFYGLLRSAAADVGVNPDIITVIE